MSTLATPYPTHAQYKFYCDLQDIVGQVEHKRHRKLNGYDKWEIAANLYKDGKKQKHTVLFKEFCKKQRIDIHRSQTKEQVRTWLVVQSVFDCQPSPSAMIHTIRIINKGNQKQKESLYAMIASHPKYEVHNKKFETLDDEWKNIYTNLRSNLVLIENPHPLSCGKVWDALYSHRAHPLRKYYQTALALKGIDVNDGNVSDAFEDYLLSYAVKNKAYHELAAFIDEGQQLYCTAMTDDGNPSMPIEETIYECCQPVLLPCITTARTRGMGIIF